MSIYATFYCDGCNAVSDRVRLSSQFVSITGRSYGFGSRQEQKLSEIAPEGWTAFDMIGCTYCPECTTALKNDDAKIDLSTGKLSREGNSHD